MALEGRQGPKQLPDGDRGPGAAQTTGPPARRQVAVRTHTGWALTGVAS